VPITHRVVHKSMLFPWHPSAHPIAMTADPTVRFAASPIPVIDLARFRGGEAERLALAREVDEACRSIGFLVIVGHGVDPALIDEVDALGRQFFDLPLEARRRCDRRGTRRGYSAVGTVALARTRDGATSPADLRETFSFGRPTIDPDDPYYSGEEGQLLFQPNIFPEELPDMRPALGRYYAAMSDLAAEIMELFALALGLEQDWFADSISRHITNLMITNYPAQAVPPGRDQLRAGAHTDFGTLTILRAEDKPGGLEVCAQDGEWHMVPILPDSFVINIGDLMARWTNDRWRSTLHRVGNPPSDAGMSARRQSIIFFHQPNYDADIRCLPSCIGEGARYAPTTSGAHLLAQVRRSQVAAG
jgi:isopenicillin N synthase-like dioxygenase